MSRPLIRSWFVDEAGAVAPTTVDDHGAEGAATIVYQQLKQKQVNVSGALKVPVVVVAQMIERLLLLFQRSAISFLSFPQNFFEPNFTLFYNQSWKLKFKK